jgi:hypothetical protein
MGGLSARTISGLIRQRIIRMSSVSRISPAEELAEFLARRPSPAEIAAFHLSDSALERVRELMDKNENGALSSEESRELDRLALLDDIIGLIQVGDCRTAAVQ